MALLPILVIVVNRHEQFRHNRDDVMAQ